MANAENDDPEQLSDCDGHDDSLTEAPLSCSCCRRRKLRCSKELPTCQNCRKTGSLCSYESKRGKPGMKVGAIGLLHKRIDNLEKLVETQRACAEQSKDQRSPRPSPTGETSARPFETLAFFAREFQRFNNQMAARPQFPPRPAMHPASIGVKRRRLDVDLPPPALDPTDEGYSCSNLDSNEIELLIQAYFSCVHPWIPMIHEGRFRTRLGNEKHQGKLKIIIQAMAFCAARYVEDAELSSKLLLPQTQARMKDGIIAAAMKQLTVENSQALVIVSFNEIGNGRASQVWSVIGALSRNVEYLQLATETADTERLRVSQPIVSIAPGENWTEVEERRRVFWTVFNLDRLCSVMTGWNTSLTSDDVCRRLPCDGIKWRKEDEVTTPYFGIWDKSAGRIGNLLMVFPTNYPPKPDQMPQTPSDASTSPDVQQGGQEDMSTVGAFAYAVEATESLSRVTTYFLQQRVDMRDQRDITSWLTRFKELDLRLVHWKMLLPQKWKVDPLQHQNARMDPNLTLAHVTHNASMILLHQLIAFPPQEWTFRHRLPSVCSADTCYSAAVEIATIAENYLRTAPPLMPVSSQFSFCIYIAARVLLLGYRDAKGGEFAPQFWSLMKILDVMANRWAGPTHKDGRTTTPNLAQKYINRLELMVTRLTQNPEYSIPVTGYTREIDHSHETPTRGGSRSTLTSIDVDLDNAPAEGAPQPTVTPGPVASASNMNGMQDGQYGFHTAARQMHIPADTISVRSGSSQLQEPSIQPARPGAVINPSDNYSRPNSDLGEISQLLLNQQFMELNRVISYNDGMFGAEFEGAHW